MMRKFFFGALPIILLLVGCPNTQSLQPVSKLSSIECGGLQYPESGGMVFRDAGSWEAFWNRYCKVITGEGNKLPAPEVDFSVQMLVGVFSGEKPTGGYSISIQRVLDGPKRLVVEYLEKSPPPDAMVTMALTYPCQIIAVPRSDKSVEFKAVKKD